MFNRYFSGLKLSSSALALLLIAAGLYFGACSKDKEEGTGQVEETEEVEVEVETPEEPEVAGRGGDGQEEGLPPEIRNPGRENLGDPCVVIVTGGMEIKGTCKMTTKQILGCNPTP
jgi:hypothetical protein